MPITQEEEEEFERNQYTLNQVKTNLDAILQQREVIEAASMDIQRAITSLEGLMDVKKDSELMIPLGGESFIAAKSTDVKNVVVGIGSGIYVEKPVKDALEVLSKRAENLSEHSQRILTNISELELKAQELNARNQEIFQKSQDAGIEGIE